MKKDNWPQDLIPFLREKLPTLEEVTAIEDTGDMGPVAAIPAIYVHLLLLRIEELQAAVTLAEMAPKAALFDAWAAERMARGESGIILPWPGRSTDG